MKVYHGSHIAIEGVDLSFGQKSRDFGKGFYVTKFREQAETWAQRKGLRKKTLPVVTEFDFAEHFFRDKFLKVLRFDDYNDEWLDFVMLNRMNETEQPISTTPLRLSPASPTKARGFTGSRGRRFTKC